MKENQPDPIRSRSEGVVFFGRIMANVSHEFNNVITVISELAGLLKDLSLMTRKGREISPDKLISIADNISRQVARGKHLVSNMNQFSHSADEPSATIDAGRAVENMLVLTDRIFKNRQTGVSFPPPEDAFSLNTDPYEFRRILFSCLDRFLDASSTEVSVTLHRSEDRGDLEMRISGQFEKTVPGFSSQFDRLKEEAAQLNGRLLCELNERCALIRLILPSNRT